LAPVVENFRLYFQRKRVLPFQGKEIKSLLHSPRSKDSFNRKKVNSVNAVTDFFWKQFIWFNFCKIRGHTEIQSNTEVYSSFASIYINPVIN
jgi:hypothetical protein